MSEQNVQIVKSGYAAFARGDIPAVLALLDSGIEWTLPDSLPFGGTYRGPQEVARFFGKLPDFFPELRVEPEEFAAFGDQVVARGHHRGRGKAGALNVPFAMFWTLRNGKVVKFFEYQDTAKTAKAIGL